ncbi:hypothetical protein BST61_g9193 [Cercospora zeina]
MGELRIDTSAGHAINGRPTRALYGGIDAAQRKNFRPALEGVGELCPDLASSFDCLKWTRFSPPLSPNDVLAEFALLQGWPTSVQFVFS